MAYLKKRSYTVKLPDGTTEKRKTKHYSIRVTENGRRSWVKGYVDRGATLQLAAELERKAARGERAMVDPFEEHKRTLLADHLVEYLAELEAKGRDDEYRYNVGQRLKVLLKECGWRFFPDVSVDSFSKWRRNRAKVGSKWGADKKLSNGASAKTLNEWLNTARGFLNWMVQNERAPLNPLIRVERVSGETVRNRRALTEDQIVAVIAAAPVERHLPWELLLSTGLRVQEATDLEWRDVRIDGDHATRPSLSLRMSRVKSRRAQFLPIRVDLGDQLRAIRPKGFKTTDPVLTRMPTLDEWKADLIAAGIEYMDGEGRQLDRHALRTTLGTRLAQAGVSPRLSMELMRHSDLRLTMKNYTDASQLDTSGAVESLPAVRKEKSERGTVAGTVEGDKTKKPRK